MNGVPVVDSAARFSATERAFVEDLAAIMVGSGLQRMPSRVYACLLTSEQGAMTAAELAQTLAVSPAAVSTAVRWLSQIGMISRRPVPGSRREQYVVDSDSLPRLIANDTRAIAAWRAGMETGLSVFSPGGAAAGRLAELADFFEFLEGEMAGVMTRWQARRAQPSPSRSARKR